MTLSVTINTSIAATVAGANDLAGAIETVSVGKTTGYSDGTANGQANKIFASQRRLAVSASENLDLNGGGLLDPNNAALNFATIRAIYVRANDDNTDDVIVGGAASNAFVGPFGGTTPTVAIKPGCEMLITNKAGGWTVTAGTGDLLKVLNGGSTVGGVGYQIILIGT